MKTKLTQIKSLVMLFCFALISVSGLAQNSVTVLLTNDAQVSPTEYQVDVYLVSNGPGTVELASSQYGINYNTGIKNGGTITASWVSGSTQLSNTAQLQATINTTSNLSQIRIAGTSAPGTGNGSIIALTPGTKVGRLRLINTVAFAQASPNLVFSSTASASSTRTQVSAYISSTNTVLCPPGLTTGCSGSTSYSYSLTNPTLNGCVAPTLSATTTAPSCVGLTNGSVDLTTTGGTSTPFTFVWSNGATTEDLSNVAAGTYTVTVTTNTGGCTASASYTVSPGTSPSAPTGLACYQTATLNTSTCSYDITGTQPAQPSLACYQTATWNGTTCQWDVTGTQPAQPSLACYETATFNNSTCSWDVTGTQPSQPTLACYETASFNTNTCSWDVTGTQPSQPSIACYETATFNGQTCSWDVTGTQPSQPTLACYETASFNTNTCSWDVTGTQPSQPTLACYETASFNTNTCSWDVTGTQPAQPTLACYETASFNNNTCSWDVTGSPAAAIVSTETACDSYVWSMNGTTYTASGTYSYYANCQDYVLNLTVIQSTSNATSVTNCYSYTWPVSGQTYTASGSYSHVSGCHTEILNLTIPGLVANAGSSISGTALACLPGINGTGTFSVAAVANATSYSWTVPTGMTISAGQGTNTIVVSWTGTDIQNGIAGQLCMTAIGPCNSGPVNCININYQVAKPVTPGTISGTNKMCPGATETFSITPVARASSYTWTVPANTTIVSGQGSNVITVSVQSGFSGGTVSVIASNACGDSPIRTKAVATNPPATPAAISGSATGVCNSSSTYSVAAISGATSYAWVVSGGTITSGQGTTSITVSFGQVSIGTITVQAVNGCGSSLIRSLTVKGSPAQPGVISGTATPCVSVQYPYSVATVNGASNYTWTTTFAGSVLAGQGTKNATVRWNQLATSQTLAVSASNACGTSPIRGLSNIASSNCTRIGDDAGVFTLTAFPNPASDRVTILFNAPADGDYLLTITDISGRSVVREELDLTSGISQKEYDLSTVSSGMYFVVLEKGSETQKIRLIVE